MEPWRTTISSFQQLSSAFHTNKMEALEARPDKTHFHVRSTSLPSRSHSLTTSIEDELTKLRQWQEHCCSTPKADMICAGLFALCRVYDCVKEQLQLPQTQQSLHQHKQEKWVEQVMEASIRVADICGSVRDLLVSLKECARDLQSSLRIGRIALSGEAYKCSRKKIKKNVNKCISSMKALFKNTSASESTKVQKLVRVLKELEEMTIFIFRRLLSWIEMPKQRSLVAKIVRRAPNNTCEVDDDHQLLSEVELVDHAVCCLSTSQISLKRRDAQKKLQDLEVCIESLEGGLEYLSRHLIQTRAFLLNIFTC